MAMLQDRNQLISLCGLDNVCNMPVHMLVGSKVSLLFCTLPKGAAALSDTAGPVPGEMLSVMLHQC